MTRRMLPKLPSQSSIKLSFRICFFINVSRNPWIFILYSGIIQCYFSVLLQTVPALAFRSSFCWLLGPFDMPPSTRFVCLSLHYLFFSTFLLSGTTKSCVFSVSVLGLPFGQGVLVPSIRERYLSNTKI